MFFKSKKPEPIRQESATSKDLAIITQMNQEFATSLDLNETLQTALEVIIKRINAQAANIFLINDKIYTTIDYQLQIRAEKALKEHLSYLQEIFYDHWRGYTKAPFPKDFEQEQIDNIYNQSIKI